MEPTNCSTETHCNYTCILFTRNTVVTTTVTNKAAIRNVEIMWDKFNVNRMLVNFGVLLWEGNITTRTNYTTNTIRQ